MKLLRIALVTIGIAAITITQCAKKDDTQNASSKKAKAPAVITVRNLDDFKQIIEQNPDRLLVFDLYADWCMPCRILSPMLEEIAQEQKKNASFYKVDVDKMPQVAQMFQVQGIPYVVFLKNKQAVYALTGVRQKAEYIEAVVKYSQG